MENKSYRSLIWSVGILAIFVLGLSGYIVYEKILIKEQSIKNSNESIECENNNESSISSNSDINYSTVTADDFILENCYKKIEGDYWKDLICNEFDKDEASDIMNNYRMSAGFYILDLADDYKNEAALQNLTGTKVLCQDYFDINSDITNCYKNEKIGAYKYSELLKKKKELFGINSILEKSDFYYGGCSSYKYISEIDSFVYGGDPKCGLSSVIEEGIINAYETDEALFIFTYVFLSVEEFGNPILRQNVYTFKAENNNYILNSITALKNV